MFNAIIVRLDSSLQKNYFVLKAFFFQFKLHFFLTNFFDIKF